MPVYTRKADKARVLRFGSGDIAICDAITGESGRHNQLVFAPGDKQSPLTVMIFESIESLDDLIKECERLRDFMAEEEDRGRQMTFAPSKGIHVYPVSDLIGHQMSLECPCAPNVNDDGIVVHRSLDGRELDEQAATTNQRAARDQ